MNCSSYGSEGDGDSQRFFLKGTADLDEKLAAGYLPQPRLPKGSPKWLYWGFNITVIIPVLVPFSIPFATVFFI